MQFGKGMHLILWLLLGSLVALGGCDDDDDVRISGLIPPDFVPNGNLRMIA
jgi:hypothetical protein